MPDSHQVPTYERLDESLTPSEPGRASLPARFPPSVDYACPQAAGTPWNLSSGRGQEVGTLAARTNRWQVPPADRSTVGPELHTRHPMGIWQAVHERRPMRALRARTEMEDDGREGAGDGAAALSACRGWAGAARVRRSGPCGTEEGERPLSALASVPSRPCSFGGCGGYDFDGRLGETERRACVLQLHVNGTSPRTRPAPPTGRHLTEAHHQA